MILQLQIEKDLIYVLWLTLLYMFVLW